MRKKLLMKSLLVAAALCVGGNAWADLKTVTLFNQDFESVTSETLSTVWENTSAYPASLVTGDATYGNYVSCTGTKSNNDQARNVIKFYTSSDIYNYEGELVKNYTIEFDALIYSYVRTTNLYLFMDGADVSSAPANPLFAFGNKAWKNSTVRITTHNNTEFNLSNTDWYHYSFTIDGSDNEKVSLSYTITNKNSNTTIKSGAYNIAIAEGITYKCQGIYIGKALYDGVLYADNFKVTTKVEVSGDVAEAPTITPTGIVAEGRSYRISFLEGETLHYTLPGETEKTVSEGTYADVTATSSGTLSAYTTKGIATSGTTSMSVDVTPVPLNAPTYSLVDLSTGYVKTYKIAINNTAVEFAPDATMSYVFTPDGGVAQEAVEIANGGTINATSKGVYVITATKAGYASSELTITNNTAYRLDREIKLSDITSEELKASSLWTSGNGYPRSNWSSIMASDQLFYELTDPATDANDAIDGINVWNNESAKPTIYPGFGLFAPYAVGNYGNITIDNGRYDEYAVYTEYTGSGSNNNVKTVKPANQSFGIYRLDNILQNIKVFAIDLGKVSVPCTNGFATYANHDVALDFTGVSGLTAYTATVEGDVVTFTPATRVPAGTGLLLKGATADVPVIASADAISENIFYAPTTAVASLNYDQDDYYNYILTSVGGNVGFYRANDNSVAVGKAYLRIAKSTGARQFTFIGLDNDGETTGVADVKNVNSDNENFYNLNGQRIVAPQKGLYIVNGKKVIIK